MSESKWKAFSGRVVMSAEVRKDDQVTTGFYRSNVEEVMEKGMISRRKRCLCYSAQLEDFIVFIQRR